MPIFRHPRTVFRPSTGMRSRLKKYLRNAICLGILSSTALPIAAEPPYGSDTLSSRKNPLRSSVESGAKIPANDLRSNSKPASAWRSELFAVNAQLELFVSTMHLIGSLPTNSWTIAGPSIHSFGCSAIAKSAEQALDASASIEIGLPSAGEPSKFTQGEDFLASDASSQTPERSNGKSQEVGKSPTKRELKTSDEDMQDYLSQEFEPTQTPQTDRSLQGVDAEKAEKPDLYGESRFGQSESDERQQTAAQSFYGSPAQQARLDRVLQTLDYYLDNPETTAARSPWAVMHALLAFGSDYEMIGPNNKRVNAVGWMCHNGLCKTQRIFTPRGNGFVPNVGGGVQGHQGQFLAILAQCQVPPDYPIQIGNNKYTVQDLVRYEMATCKERSELTFKLIGLSYYLESNKQWRANDGKVWSIQKLIQEELAQPIVGAACGGTHRLMGFSFALKQRSLQGEPITGQYLRAAKFVEDFISYTWRLQNPDGSFSTNWYESRGNDPNDERKVQTSGHMLEWLLFTVNDEELQSPRVEKAVDFLLSKIYDSRSKKWPIGPRGHATRALAIYSARMATAGESDAESTSAPVVASIQKESARPQVAPATPAPKPQTAAPRSRSASPSQVRTRR